MNKILISLAVAFSLGFVSSRIFSGKKESDHGKETVQCAELNEAKANLMSISQNEYLEYIKIKDLKQKYEKADELLGKIMLLFLADVGFRVQKSEPVEIATPASEMQAPVVANQPMTQTPATEDKKPTNLTDRSAFIRSLGNEKRIVDALENVVIENPKLEAAKGTTPSRRQIKLLEGRYVGTVSFFDTKRGSLSVIWDLVPDYSKKGLSGTFTLSIHGPGTNSESSGRGDIDSIVSLAQDPNGVIVNGCGGSCYMQLYYNTRSEQFYGNYYEVPKGTQGKAERVGIVKLGR